jgi:hypothetical protein
MDGEKMKNNAKALVISIICVVVFIICIIAVSYAYYTANVSTTNDKNNITTVSTTELKATFTDGEEVNIDNMFPGNSYTKTFTLANTGEKELTYKICINDVTNTFSRTEDIVLKIYEDGTLINTTTFPTTSAAITDELTIATGTTKSYTITITYTNSTTENQADDMNKTISGKIFIE